MEEAFITRKEFLALAKELRKEIKAEVHRSRFEHERNKLISQGRWAPPLPEENK